MIAELVQLTRPQLVQLQLGVRAQDLDHMGGGLHLQLVQLKLAKLVQLQLDVQAHVDGMGGQQRRHPVCTAVSAASVVALAAVVWQEHVWHGGRDRNGPG